VLQAAHFFNSLFLKVSVDQFSQNRHIPIRNSHGGGTDTFSFSGRKAWSQQEILAKIGQSLG
jgi:hypothetical protein